MRSRPAPPSAADAMYAAPPSAMASAASAMTLGAPARLLALRPSALAAARVPKFLRSLYDILYHEDASILAWAPDGASFQIFDTRRLEAAVLPKYFKHSKFASFQRQLNNFGFRKWTKTQSSVCTFSHQHLARCHPLHLPELLARQAAAAGAAPRSPPAAHKRALDDAAVKPADSRISPRAAKLIKREPLAASAKPAAATAAVAAAAAEDASDDCALDPALFQRPDALWAADAFGLPLDDLGDLLLAAPDAYDRSFELRMLNECLDLAPPAGSFVGLLTGAGEPLAPSPFGAWADPAAGRADVAL